MTGLVLWPVFGSGLPRWGRWLGVGLGLIALLSIGLDAQRYGLPWAMALFLFQRLPSIVGALMLTGWLITHLFPDTLLASGSREDRLRGMLTTLTVAVGSAIVVSGLFEGIPV